MLATLRAAVVGGFPAGGLRRKAPPALVSRWLDAGREPITQMTKRAAAVALLESAPLHWGHSRLCGRGERFVTGRSLGSSEPD